MCEYIGTWAILGLTLLKGYGFIQYETEVVAQAAVAGERGSSLKGFVIGKYDYSLLPLIQKVIFLLFLHAYCNSWHAMCIVHFLQHCTAFLLSSAVHFKYCIVNLHFVSVKVMTNFKSLISTRLVFACQFTIITTTL